MVLFGKLARAGGTALVRLNRAEDRLDVTVEEEEAELEES
jgi:ATP-dependent Clp protease ATP-binding subunit ClpA